ncbi:hypothetical protein [Aeromicrobium stalagmiti]|uniref:hypothetical protein n=1 Tax=Aeromicrobium stalagmiti TaxID=2738988 RepID=UPI001568DC50|nr:hypothetical protein [Aeromicrobium stalagmiti]NRQ50453.1 hypothetical protein [Aeromicrobium stalagmiti]
MRWGAGAAVAVVLLAAACSGTDGRGTSPRASATTTTTSTPTAEPAPTPTYPGREWARAEQGDWEALDAELAADGSTCVAVVKDGRLVHDAYWNGGAPDAR